MYPTQVNQSTSKQTPFFTDDLINEHITHLMKNSDKFLMFYTSGQEIT